MSHLSGESIYLDYAASTPVRREALEAMMPFFSQEFGNPSGRYGTGRRASDALDVAHEQVADVLGALPQEIVFTSGGTESINAAIKGVAFAQDEAGSGKHVITTQVEHHAVLLSGQYLERFGFDVEYLPVDETGSVSSNDVVAAVREDTVLVSVMYANNEVGTIQPLSEIAHGVRERAGELGRRIPVHTDAVQAATSLELDVDTLGVDLVSLSGHKFGGPKGTGVLYLRRDVPFLEQLSGGGQERQRRSGTENVAGAVGLSTALSLAQNERDAFSVRAKELRERLLSKVQSFCSDVRLNGHPTKRLPQNLHLSFDGVEGEAVVEALDSSGVECSTGAACTSSTWEPSHVLLAMGVPLDMAVGSVRICTWPTLSEADIDYVAEKLPTTIKRLRTESTSIL